MSLPQLNGEAASRDWVESFGGYNHNLKIADGEFYDMLNLTSDSFPLVSPRDKRFKIGIPTGSIFEEHNIMVCDMTTYDGDVWCLVRTGEVESALNSNKILLVRVTYNNTESLIGQYRLGDAIEYYSLTYSYMVKMGAYICVFPEGYYINMSTGETGRMSEMWEQEYSVYYSLVNASGDAYQFTKSSTAPATPTDGMYWLDTSEAKYVLKQYSEALTTWSPVSPYIKIRCKWINDNDFKEGDSVSIYNAKTGVEFNKYTPIVKSGGLTYDTRYLIVKGMISDSSITSGGEIEQPVPSEPEKPLYIIRDMPVMDYVIEHNNRLWGCRYGDSQTLIMRDIGEQGEFVNEIYACELGNPRSWRKYNGDSTDSYTVSLGRDGNFTGAAVYNNIPLFFREDCVHKIYGNIPSNFQLQTQDCVGVKDWDGVNFASKNNRSLVTVDNVLFYLGADGVYAYTGSTPQKISNAFKTDGYFGAVGFAYNGKYYLSVSTSSPNGDYVLLVYDVSKAMWHKEEGKTIHCATSGTDCAFFFDDDVAWLNEPKAFWGIGNADGTEEPIFSWYGESGNIGLYTSDNKYLQKITMRMSLDVGARVAISIMYDSSGKWERMFTATGTNLTSFNVPIRPRRCDHFRIRIDGTGEAKIYSLSKTITQGSDVYR